MRVTVANCLISLGFDTSWWSVWALTPAERYTTVTVTVRKDGFSLLFLSVFTRGIWADIAGTCTKRSISDIKKKVCVRFTWFESVDFTAGLTCVAGVWQWSWGTGQWTGAGCWWRWTRSQWVAVLTSECPLLSAFSGRPCYWVRREEELICICFLCWEKRGSREGWGWVKGGGGGGGDERERECLAKVNIRQ